MIEMDKFFVLPKIMLFHFMKDNKLWEDAHFKVK